MATPGTRIYPKGVEGAILTVSSADLNNNKALLIAARNWKALELSNPDCTVAAYLSRDLHFVVDDDNWNTFATRALGGKKTNKERYNYIMTKFADDPVPDVITEAAVAKHLKAISVMAFNPSIADVLLTDGDKLLETIQLFNDVVSDNVYFGAEYKKQCADKTERGPIVIAVWNELIRNVPPGVINFYLTPHGMAARPKHRLDALGPWIKEWYPVGINHIQYANMLETKSSAKGDPRPQKEKDSRGDKDSRTKEKDPRADKDSRRKEKDTPERAGELAKRQADAYAILSELPKEKLTSSTSSGARPRSASRAVPTRIWTRTAWTPTARS
jgi:hypothetical protein